MKAKVSASIEIAEIKTGNMPCYVVGTTPLITNEMSGKAKREMLLPAKKNRAAKHSTLKHNVVQEFRDSMRYDHSDDGPTRLLLPSPAFRKAMQTAALDIPGATKSEIVRLVRVEGYSIPVYGIPRLRMDVVKQAGFTGAPDIRTRACLVEWCCPLMISYRIPNLTGTTIINLLHAAGLSVGVGDYRQEKGAGDFGLFEVVQDTDPRVKALVKNAGRVAQDEAIANPMAFDAATEDLWQWYEAEIVKQGRKEVV